MAEVIAGVDAKNEGSFEGGLVAAAMAVNRAMSLRPGAVVAVEIDRSRKAEGIISLNVVERK